MKLRALKRGKIAKGGCQHAEGRQAAPDEDALKRDPPRRLCDLDS